MTELQTLLSEFEALLKDTKAPILNKLGMGIDISAPEYTSIQLPKDAEILYKWKNGVVPKPGDTIGSLYLFPMGIFLSVNNALRVQNVKAGSPTGWDSNKFPLFESGGGEYFLIECSPSSKQYGTIYFHSIGDVEFDKIISTYDSLLTLFTTLFECYKAGIYPYEECELKNKRYLEVEIGKRHNPLSEYWKLFD